MNHGLMNQVISAFRRFTMLKLGKTYAKLRISDVARLTYTKPADVTEIARYVKGLIESGELKGSLSETGSDTGSWVLCFFDEAEDEVSETQLFEEISQKTDKIKALNARIRESDHKLGLTKEYLDWQKKMAAQKDAPGMGADEGTGEFVVADEDMMMDI